MDVKQSSDIKDNFPHYSNYYSNDYLCEASKEWIKNNLKLVHDAQTNKEAFAKLIQKLESDINLRKKERILVYRDICEHFWKPNQMFGITHNDDNFLGQIFECDPPDFED